MTPAELGHLTRRQRICLDATAHRKRAVAYGRAADRYGDRSVKLFAELKRLETLEKWCREKAMAHTWAAKVSPRKGR